MKTLVNKFGNEISVKNAQNLLGQETFCTCAQCQENDKPGAKTTFEHRAAIFEGNEISLRGYAEWQKMGFQVQKGEKAFSVTVPNQGKEKTTFWGGKVFASFQVKKIEKTDAPGTEIALSAE